MPLTNRFVQFMGLGVLLIGGCSSIPTSGDPLAPVRVATPTAKEPESDTVVSEGGFDFDADLRDEEEEGAGDAEELDDDPLALQAAMLGLPAPEKAPEAQPAAVAAPAAAAVAPQVPSVPEVPAWDPSAESPGGSWGIRLLATLHDVHPPRAVIGLPSGEEKVVQAGTMMPAERLVVMAIGRDVVEVAHILPNGFYASIDTQSIPALFPAGSGSSATR